MKYISLSLSLSLSHTHTHTHAHTHITAGCLPQKGRLNEGRVLCGSGKEIKPCQLCPLDQYARVRFHSKVLNIKTVFHT